MADHNYHQMEEESFFERKRRFFEDLDRFHNDSDGEEDTSDAASFFSSSRVQRESKKPSNVHSPAVSVVNIDAGRRSPPQRLPGLSTASPHPRDTMSSTQPMEKSTVGQHKAFADISMAYYERPVGTRERANEVAREPSGTKNKANGSKKISGAGGGIHKGKQPKKRRWDATPPLVAESRRIFRGLVFFYAPNCTASDARRQRISKAKEYGAVKASECNDSVTHIVVDQNIHFDEVLRVVGLTRLPRNVILVSDNYMHECVTYQCLIDPTRSRFQVRGFVAPTSTDMNPTMDADREGEETLPTEEISRLASNVASSSAATPVEQSRTVLNLERMDIYSRKRRARDEPEEVLAEVQASVDGPLYRNVSETEAIADDSDRSSDDDRLTKGQKKRTNSPASRGSWQDGQLADANPNARTIELLQEMASNYDRMNDHWRTTAYRKAIRALKKETVKIVTKKQAMAIPSIGERLAEKIEEITQTNHLQRLDYIENDPNDQLRMMFTQIYGAGPTVAQRWIAQGHKSLQDLIEKAELTKNQEIGIQHYEDFLSRIPRAEVEKHGEVVRNALTAVDDEIRITIGGSYRRGESDCGDIDVVITKPEATIEDLRVVLLETVIPDLFSQGFLKAGLATLTKHHGSKWHGASALPGSATWRRIDLLLVPWKERGAAMLYFTGNDLFNRHLRLRASRKGMRLNEKGLYKDVIRGPGREKLNAGTLVEAESEERIFEILGEPWRSPQERN